MGHSNGWAYWVKDHTWPPCLSADVLRLRFIKYSAEIAEQAREPDLN